MLGSSSSSWVDFGVQNFSGWNWKNALIMSILLPLKIRLFLLQTKVLFLKILLRLTTAALPTTVVATATLVVVAEPTVAAIMAPPMFLAPGNSNNTGPIFLLLFGPIETTQAHLHFHLLLLLVGIIGLMLL